MARSAAHSPPEPRLQGSPMDRRGWRRRLHDTSWVFNLGADVYAWFTSQSTWRASCARLAKGLPTQRGLLVADLGCGPGTSAFALARLRPDARVVGLDIAQRMVRRASRQGRAAGLGPVRLAYTVGDATRLPFRSAVLDAVTGHSFLYQVPDRRATLAEIARVVRPGGRLLLMEPNDRPADLLGALRRGSGPRHLIAVSLWRPFSRLHGRFTAETLRATLQAAGFEQCRVEETLGGLGLLATATRP